MKDKHKYRTFVRFGKLGLVKQKAYNKSDSYHAPPAPRGFYAMPIRFQEYFLIGTLCYTQPEIFNLRADDENFDNKRKKLYKTNFHTFNIDKDCEFWHHLPVKNEDVLDRHGTWVKTTYRVWRKSISKESMKLRAFTLEFCKRLGVRGSLGIENTMKRTGSCSKDHFEVFFDKKVF